ncbi:Formyl-coenzyme A transferase [Oligella ureolytica]|uniref:CaiB/BaiF CoA transferase family protein n=1 Tax=Oligella ureolytica TaxID=90244 RepID=UPI000E08B2DC|nr:CoA transferase [Oligella ureolytica]SUA59094.1 Formyl-coenzyme A transferase [Oligella ureolytica]
MQFDPTTKGPLHGIKVLDISRLVAGNMLSLQLGDLGADVIKVEPPSGDPLRAWKDEGFSFFWKTYSRNKRSIVLNLREENDMSALRQIIKKCDVMIENYRPGTLEKMGLAPNVLLDLNPNLIVVRISGFGQTGPYSQLPGFGTLVEAMSGFAARTGFPDREPVLPPLALADMITGIYGSNAVTTALFARERGDVKGQVIDLSLLEPMFSVLGPEAAIFKKTGIIKQRVGSGSNTTSPRNVYQCNDGRFVALSGSTQNVAERIFEIVGQPDLINDPRFCNNSERVKNRHEVDKILSEWFAQYTREEALKIMRDAGATVGPVYDIEDAVDDKHFIERQVIINIEDDDFGQLPMHNIVPRFSHTPGVWRHQAPKLGEHTQEILEEFDVSSEIIDNITKNQ